MKSQHLLKFFLGVYIFIFLMYLFGPLIIMSILHLIPQNFLPLPRGNVLVGDGFKKVKLPTMANIWQDFQPIGVSMMV